MGWKKGDYKPGVGVFSAVGGFQEGRSRSYLAQRPLKGSVEQLVASRRAGQGGKLVKE